MILHAFTGCDTTSTIYAKGKTLFLKTIVASDEIRDAMEVISNPWENRLKLGMQDGSCFLICMVEQEMIT